MAKYAQKSTKKKSSNLIVWVVAACCIALPVAIIAISWILGDHPAAPVAPSTTTVPGGSSVLVPTFPTIPDESTQPNEDTVQYPYLSDNLSIEHIGKYSGIFMEDGTDENVSNVLMLTVKNTGTEIWAKNNYYRLGIYQAIPRDQRDGGELEAREALTQEQHRVDRYVDGGGVHQNDRRRDRGELHRGKVAGSRGKERSADDGE